MAKGQTQDDGTLGVGLDVGTMNVVSARKTASGVETRRVRDAFLELPVESKKMLKLANVSYVERADELLILGDAAMDTANIFGREARRPLAAGLVSSSDVDAMEILGLLIKNVLGDPKAPNEHCYFSVPAAPMDKPGQDVIYHRGVLERIVRECGYTPTAGNEASAIIYAETAKENFSGIALSFGSGMTNCSLVMNTIEGLSFSVSRCLSKDFPVVTRRGVTKMHDIAVGDEILDANGCFVPVLEKLDNGTREFLKEVTLENLPAFPHQMTSDHRVFVRRRFGWEWVPAGDLHVGDEVGIPTVKAQRDSGSSYYFGRDDAKNITVAGARNLGRFFGVFLGDGSCGGVPTVPDTSSWRSTGATSTSSRSTRPSATHFSTATWRSWKTTLRGV